MTTTTLNPTATERQDLLRRALLADGIVSGGAGAVLLLAAEPFGDLFGMPTVLLRWAGVSLFPFAAVLVYLATRPRIPRRYAWGVVGYNLLWAIDSILLLALGWVEPTALGYAFVLVQALAVLGFAELQYFGLRRSA